MVGQRAEGSEGEWRMSDDQRIEGVVVVVMMMLMKVAHIHTCVFPILDDE